MVKSYIEIDADSLADANCNLLRLAEEVMTKMCCEGGKMSAGCYHDHCTGPKEIITTYSIQRGSA